MRFSDFKPVTTQHRSFTFTFKQAALFTKSLLCSFKEKESIYGSTGVSSLTLYGLEGEDVLLTVSMEQDETISQHQALTSF